MKYKSGRNQIGGESDGKGKEGEERKDSVSEKNYVFNKKNRRKGKIYVTIVNDKKC